MGTGRNMGRCFARSDWELVETFFISLVNEYLSSGKYAGKLKEYQAIGIGFVDGDLQILYAR